MSATMASDGFSRKRPRRVRIPSRTRKHRIARKALRKIRAAVPKHVIHKARKQARRRFRTYTRKVAKIVKRFVIKQNRGFTHWNQWGLLKSTRSNKCLQAWGHGDFIKQVDCKNGNSHQHFRIINNGGWVRILNKQNLVIDDRWGQAFNGNLFWLWDQNWTPAQNFIREHRRGRIFGLHNMASNRCLDTTGSNNAGVNVHNWDCSKFNVNQDWVFVPVRNARRPRKVVIPSHRRRKAIARRAKRKIKRSVPKSEIKAAKHQAKRRYRGYAKRVRKIIRRNRIKHNRRGRHPNRRHKRHHRGHKKHHRGHKRHHRGSHHIIFEGFNQIRNRKTKRCIRDNGSSAKLSSRKCNKKYDGFYWKLKRQGDGRFTIKSDLGHYLEKHGKNKLIAGHHTGNHRQKWRVIKKGRRYIFKQGHQCLKHHNGTVLLSLWINTFFGI